MKTSKGFGSALLAWLKNLVTKNVVIKIISLVFAMLLWGYVLMDQNPSRTKTVMDVPVNFESGSESDLIARKLVIRGDRDEMLNNVDVKVDTQLAQYADMDADSIAATVSLRTVTQAGVYSLPVNARTTVGTVVSYSPARITVEVDDLVTRRIPIEVMYMGELPEGYWCDDAVLSRSEIEIEGASKDVSQIVKAICKVDLSDRTESMNESVDLTLVDNTDYSVSSSLLLGQLPVVSVKLEVLKTAKLNIDVESAIAGRDSLPKNYEIASIAVSPSSEVTVAGSQSDIDAAGGVVDIDIIDVSGSSESIVSDVTLTAPHGLKILSDPEVSVFVNIREKNEEVVFEGMPIKIIGAGNRQVSISADSTDVTMSGRLSLIRALRRSEVSAYVDVTDMSAGTYNLKVMIELPDAESRAELSYVLSIDSVKATIRE